MYDNVKELLYKHLEKLIEKSAECNYIELVKLSSAIAEIAQIIRSYEAY